MPDNTTDSAKTADRLKRLIEIATQLNATYNSDELLQLIMTGATELTDDGLVAHHVRAIADGDNLRQLGADHQHGGAASHQPIDDPV